MDKRCGFACAMTRPCISNSVWSSFSAQQKIFQGKGEERYVASGGWRTNFSTRVSKRAKSKGFGMKAATHGPLGAPSECADMAITGACDLFSRQKMSKKP